MFCFFGTLNTGLRCPTLHPIFFLCETNMEPPSVHILSCGLLSFMQSYRCWAARRDEKQRSELCPVGGGVLTQVSEPSTASQKLWRPQAFLSAQVCLGQEFAVLESPPCAHEQGMPESCLHESVLLRAVDKEVEVWASVSWMHRLLSSCEGRRKWLDRAKRTGSRGMGFRSKADPARYP